MSRLYSRRVYAKKVGNEIPEMSDKMKEMKETYKQLRRQQIKQNQQRTREAARQ